MVRADLYGCCTGEILVGMYMLDDRPISYLKEIDRNVKDSIAEGNKMMIAITTQGQVNAEQALRTCGFSHTERFSNSSSARHMDTYLALWSLDLSTYKTPSTLEELKTPPRVTKPKPSTKKDAE